MYKVPKNKYITIRQILIVLLVLILLAFICVSVTLCFDSLVQTNLWLLRAYNNFFALLIAVILITSAFIKLLSIVGNLEIDEEIRLSALQKKYDHLYAKNMAMDRGCTFTTFCLARIVGEMARVNPDYFSEDTIANAAELSQHISYNQAVEWMRNDGTYVERFTLTALLFKMADEGMIKPSSVYIYREMNLSKRDFEVFDNKYAVFQNKILEQQRRQAQLKGLYELAIGRLIGEMLRLNNTNYQQRAYRAIKVATKMNKKMGYQFYNNALENNQMLINDAIESVSLGLPLKKRLKFITLLFELAVDDDGIKNDEWHLLLQVLSQMNIDKKTIADFVEHYQSLRTEFDTDEYTKAVDEAEELKSFRKMLGVDEDATVKDIQDAFHRLALKHHPDLPKNAGRSEECHKIMAEINHAYAQLLVRKKKEETGTQDS